MDFALRFGLLSRLGPRGNSSGFSIGGSRGCIGGVMTLRGESFDVFFCSPDVGMTHGAFVERTLFGLMLKGHHKETN